MTIIVFWYDNHTMSVYSDPAPADQVAEAINAGLSSLDPGWIPGERWHAISEGEIVFARPTQAITKPGVPAGVPHLTPREMDVLVGLVEGLTVKDIAYRLNLQTRTVSEHTWSIRRKLGAQTREQAVGEAVRLGLVRQNDKLTGSSSS